MTIESDSEIKDSAPREGAGRDAGELGAMAEYKGILQRLLDNRPSGTRQRLAHALGKNRSFITQITNPSYGVTCCAGAGNGRP